jgi:peptidoglycan/LPS O-acetylase OafA/YrhL
VGYYPDDFALGRRPALDGVRGIAILLVLVGHGPVADLGAAPGVTMFFTLSGFLITSLLLEEWRANGRVDLRRFYARRALRLLPGLAVFLVIIGVVLARRDEPLTGAWFAALYVANLASAVERKLRYFSHTWSLSLEEQFYVVWPITLVVVARSRRRGTALAVAAAGVVLCVGLRVFAGSTDVMALAVPLRLAVFGLWRADALLVGCLLALGLGVVLRLPRQWVAAAAVVGAGVVVLTALRPRSDLYLTHWVTAVPFATAAIIVWLLQSPGGVARLLTWRPLRYTGRISYGLYLWHFPLFLLLRPELRDLHPAAEIAIASTASYAAAAVSYRVVEAPFLRLKHRFAPRPTAPEPQVVRGGVRLSAASKTATTSSL